MRITLTIARREMLGYFYSPIAYVVMCLFALLSNLMFLLEVFHTGEPAEPRQLFFWIIWILIAIVPAISMRLLAEEFRSGTVETLLTNPVTDTQVILGKWLGGLGFFAALLVPTLVCIVILEIWGEPDYGPVLTGYLGLLLVGGLYMAIGTFASAITRNQIIAFLLSIFIILFVTVVTYLLPRHVHSGWAQAMIYLNVNEQFEDFSKGLLDLTNLVYFASGIGLFLALAVKALESRKWR